MPQLLPFFPLGMVIFPGEKTQLHIFEARYRQLIAEAKERNFTFGIPFVKNNKLYEYGTEVKITRIEKYYDSGECDIEVEGLRVFHVDSFHNPLPDKLYSGGKVSYITPAGHTFDAKTNGLFVRFMQEKNPGFTNPRPASYYHIISESVTDIRQRLDLLSIDNDDELRTRLRNMLLMMIGSAEAEKITGEKFILN